MWRESATLILVAKNVFSTVNNRYNYKIITMKRSSKTPFMPGTIVFPGGNLCSNDTNIKWLELYEKFGFGKDSFDALRPKENIPAIVKRSPESDLPKDLSLRICAIRETFEECGILLCASPKIKCDINQNWASFIGGHELLEWQNKIIKDPNEFFHMCDQFEVYPDIWNLQLWSNWKTPPQLSLKFDTIFFLAALHQMPAVVVDEKEVQKTRWTTPDECIDLNSKGGILLPQPQFYELSRLKKFTHIENLAEFARERAKQGCETYWPYRVRTNKGLYAILPGDDLYPDKIDETANEPTFIPEIEDSKIKNRIYFKNEYLSQLVVENFTPKCNHVVPLS